MHPPVHPSNRPLGHWRGFRTDPISLLMEAARSGGDVVSLRMATQTLTLLRHPDHIRHILQDNVGNYSKQTRGYAQLRRLLGQGLVTSEGDFWLRQRRIAQPAFHRKQIATFGDTMATLTSEMLRHWDTLAPGTALDISEEMMALTLRIVGRTLLSTEVSGKSAIVGPALGHLLAQMIDRTTDLVQLPLAIPTARNRIFAQSLKALNGVVVNLIAERRASADRPQDLLTLLMEARDADTGEAMTDAQLRDEVMTLFLAGHETTANALAWTFYLLSQNPAAARRLREELTLALGGRTPAFEDLPKLPFTARVVQESMRLYPPVWVLARQVMEDDTVGGYLLRRGTFVAACPYVTHRDARYWPAPETFDPDRFLPERMAAQPRFAYFPFSGGPRQCIGNQFALMEAQLIVASVAQRYALELVPGHPVALQPTVTLRPRYGLSMQLKPLYGAA